MEEYTTETHLEEFAQLQVSAQSKQYLTETGKWAKFISIVGFIGIGFMIIGGIGIILGGSMLPSQTASPFPISYLGGIYLMAGILYFFPVLYLYRFSDSTSKAMRIQNQNDFDQAMLNLKLHYRFLGILLIIVMSIYALFFVGMILFGVTSFI